VSQTGNRQRGQGNPITKSFLSMLISSVLVPTQPSPSVPVNSHLKSSAALLHPHGDDMDPVVRTASKETEGFEPMQLLADV
jgi:hypothetical protein